MHGEVSLVLDFGGGLLVHHAFLVEDWTPDSYLLGRDFFHVYGGRMDLQVSQIKVSGHAYQMIC